ncbi:hypothetical protein CBC_0818 [Clostridium botulinum C str. Eklund]|nr:hypothetical protein CBC_0818 [Clostridium botulinum C str. Eklund]
MDDYIKFLKRGLDYITRTKYDTVYNKVLEIIKKSILLMMFKK